MTKSFSGPTSSSNVVTGTLPADDVSLWALLGLEEGAVTGRVELAYRASEKTPEQRYAWKALTDPAYRAVYLRHKSTKALYDAGFFLDQYEGKVQDHPAWNVNFMSTPLSEVMFRMTKEFDGRFRGGRAGPISKKKTRKCVILTTGSFSPLHPGHIQMAETAARHLADEGWMVVGHYFAPGNDSYVNTKANGEAKKDAAIRVDTARTLLHRHAKNTSNKFSSGAGNNFLYSVDPWAAEYLPYEINFTDHIARLKQYLNYHIVDERIEVAYVFGSDNAGFHYAFEEQGLAVCVRRKGQGKTSPALTHLEDITDDRFEERRINLNLHLTEEEIDDISSTAIRQGRQSYSSEAMKAYTNEVKIDHPRYLVRDEKDMAIKHWFEGRDPEVVRAAKDKLLATLIQEIKTSLDDIKVEVLDVEVQRRMAQRFVGDRKTISLDAFFEGTHNLAISRMFGLADGQLDHFGHHQRPSENPQDLDLIEPGQYILVEDDVATGSTLEFARRQIALKTQRLGTVDTDQLVVLSDFLPEQASNAAYYDVVDLRDFMVGSLHGGLVCQMPIITEHTDPKYDLKFGGVTTYRVPYLLPFVNPTSRALIPTTKRKAFSLAMWKANVEFFKEIGNPRIGEAFFSFREFADKLGWKAGASMVDFCTFHVTLLSEQS